MFVDIYLLILLLTLVLILVVAYCKRSVELAHVRSDCVQKRDRLAKLEIEKNSLLEERSALIEKVRAERRFAEERNKFALSTKEQLLDAFHSLSGQALERSSKLFMELAENQLAKHTESTISKLEKREQSFADVISPIKESLNNLESQVKTVEKERIASRDTMTMSIRQLMSVQERLSSETVGLSNALKSPVVTGQWGEMHLKRVVELSGLAPYCDFVEQVTLKSDDSVCRPDLIVRLPSDRSIVVDAKSPLKDYLASSHHACDQERNKLLARHAKALRGHINQLGQKKYWKFVEGTPELVVLFLPSESLLSSALRHDPSLLEYCIGQNVILATPLTFVALLKTVSAGWQSHLITQNVEKISEVGQDLLKRLGIFSEHFEDLHSGLDRSVKAFNRALGSFDSRVLKSAKQLAELGIVEERPIKTLSVLEQGLRCLPNFESDRDILT